MFLVYNESLLYFYFFYHGFMIHIILIVCSLVFFFFFFLKIMTSAYLFKHFNFISSYDGHFNNLNRYKCLCSNATNILN